MTLTANARKQVFLVTKKRSDKGSPLCKEIRIKSSLCNRDISALEVRDLMTHFKETRI